MRRELFTLVLIIVQLQLVAQIPDWYLPTSRNDHYPQNIYYIGYKDGIQERDETIEEALSRLTNAARVDLASTISTTIEHTLNSHTFDVITQSTNYFNEHIDERLSSETLIKSNISEVFGLKTETYRNPKDGSLAAFAYINKLDAGKFYANKLSTTYASIQSVIYVANYLVSIEKYLRARDELKKAKEEFEKSEDDYIWLLRFDYNENKLYNLLNQHNELRQLIEHKLSDLSITTTSIFMQCSGEIFDWSCSEITDVIKDRLSKLSCAFVNSPSQADWIIRLHTNAELDQKRKNDDSYFVRIEVNGTIYDVKNQQTYKLFRDERDSSFKSSGNYKIAAEKILKRETFAESIKDDIFQILISM